MAVIILATIYLPHFNNSIRVTKVAAVQAETTRKSSTAISQEKAPTEQQTVSKTETVVATVQPEQLAPQPQGCDSYRTMFSQYDWNVTTAIAVCKAESGGDTNALSSTCDRGLMQINCVHADMVDGDLSKLYNPTINISVAHRVYLSQGWAGWSTYKSGAYLRYE